MAWEAPFDPFEALGLERDADLRSIKTRYHELARRYHPNRNQGTADDKAALAEHFYHVNQAWQLLYKADKRRRCIELLDLYDVYEAIEQSAADILHPAEYAEHTQNHPVASSEGNGTSDGEDDHDLPQIAGLKKRQTFDQSFNNGSNSLLAEVPEGAAGVARAGAKRGRQPVSRLASLRGSSAAKRSDSKEQNAAAQRRKQFDRLRRKELEAFNQYRDAMVEKFEAEEAAEMLREKYEQAKWRKEYFERAPKDTNTRMKLIRAFNAARNAFTTQQPPTRQRNRSTISYPNQMLSNNVESPVDNNKFLALPSRTKSIHRRAWSSDISGDQEESSDDNENSSDKRTSPSRSPVPRAHSPRPSLRHRRWESVPNIVTLGHPHLLPNGKHDPISPITGPGPKVFVRTPTNLTEAFPIEGSDADSASASERSPSPQPRHDPSKFTLVPAKASVDSLGCSPDRRSRSPNRRTASPVGERRVSCATGVPTPVPPRPDEPPLFMIKRVGEIHHYNVPYEHVHELNYLEKKRLGVEPEATMAPEELLESLGKLDPAVASKFVIKPDIKKLFAFRLVYSHREITKAQHQSFIALSYRRKLLVERQGTHFTLPLEREMFQAVWDERLSDNEGVWIDQICIDQRSNEERTISMSAMDMVYRSARLVVVALDDIHLDIQETGVLHDHMDEYSRQVHVAANKRFRRKQPPYLEKRTELQHVIIKIMESSWFRRAWCRHEMRLAREHIFLIPCETRAGKSVVRFTGKCLTHLLALATEVPFRREIEAVKAPLYAFFRDRSKLPAHEHLHAHHGNFTTVVAEVFAMEAGGDPRIPVEQREADARKDKISIILNTMECGLALHPALRDTKFSLPTPECNYMLLLLALAARDPGALASVGRPLQRLPLDVSTSWLFEPTNVDSGLNNYRTLLRLPPNLNITASSLAGEHLVQLDLKFLQPARTHYPTQSPDTLALATRFLAVCERQKFGRNRKRYLLSDANANAHFGPMREVYIQTLACIFDLGPDWLQDVCERYGVARWKYDLQPAFGLMVALKNTSGRWPEKEWGSSAAGFLMDFANFLIIRGMPQRQIVGREEWRPVWVESACGSGSGKVLTFIPPGEIRCAVPRALLDDDYIHLARLWVLRPRMGSVEAGECDEWTLLGKSVLFGDEDVTYEMEDSQEISCGQRVFGRKD